jgi:hypothetical protein
MPLQYYGSGCESQVTTCDVAQQNMLVNTSAMYSAASAVLDNDNVTITLSLSIVPVMYGPLACRLLPRHVSVPWKETVATSLN